MSKATEYFRRKRLSDVRGQHPFNRFVMEHLIQQVLGHEAGLHMVLVPIAPKVLARERSCTLGCALPPGSLQRSELVQNKEGIVGALNRHHGNVDGKAEGKGAGAYH